MLEIILIQKLTISRSLKKKCLSPLQRDPYFFTKKHPRIANKAVKAYRLKSLQILTALRDP